jgi:hypothetical protein
MTNIRPSHYFISIPRTSVSYKRTEMPQNDSIVAVNKHHNSIRENHIHLIKQSATCETQLRETKSDLKPALPSKQRKDHQDISKTLRHYQNIRRLVADEQRKTNHLNNRWRESAGTILNTMKGEPPQTVHGCRTKATLKYNKKYNEILKNTMGKRTFQTPI